MSSKRAFDIACSIVGMPLAVIPVASAAFAIAAEHRSWPFYKEMRVGFKEKPFQIYKIKTMNNSVNPSGDLLPNEQRITKMGFLLRETRLDELPQLINILKGDMSFVGPRPLRPDSSIAHDEKRQSVRPGLTGLTQLSWERADTAAKRLYIDHQYIDQHSLWGDIILMIRTPPGLFHYLNKTKFKGLSSLKPSQG